MVVIYELWILDYKCCGRHHEIGIMNVDLTILMNQILALIRKYRPCFIIQGNSWAYVGIKLRKSARTSITVGC